MLHSQIGSTCWTCVSVQGAHVGPLYGGKEERLGYLKHREVFFVLMECLLFPVSFFEVGVCIFF